MALPPDHLQNAPTFPNLLKPQTFHKVGTLFMNKDCEGLRKSRITIMQCFEMWGDGPSTGKLRQGGSGDRFPFSGLKQEGQHPLTGQRAPPISGGT